MHCKSYEELRKEYHEKYPRTLAQRDALTAKQKASLEAAGLGHHATDLIDIAESIYLAAIGAVSLALTKDELKTLKPANVMDVFVGLLRLRTDAGLAADQDPELCRECEVLNAEIEELKRKLDSSLDGFLGTLLGEALGKPPRGPRRAMDEEEMEFKH